MSIPVKTTGQRKFDSLDCSRSRSQEAPVSRRGNSAAALFVQPIAADSESRVTAMITPIVKITGIAGLFLASLAAKIHSAEVPGTRVTILYDAFGRSSPMQKDWGFSALIEYRGM